MKFIVLLCLICYFGILSNAQEITGSVKTKDGKPVEALILPGYIETDKNGQFKLKYSNEKILVVLAKDFLPVIKKITDDQELEIILSKGDQDEKLVIPKCRMSGRGKYVGAELSLLVPDGMKGRRRDEIYYIIDKKTRKIVLHGVWGYLAGRGYPDPELINSTDKISIRAVSDGIKIVGFDYSGTTTDGKHWRHIRFRTEDVSYIVDSEVKRAIFDRVFDSACSNSYLSQ